MQVRSSDMMWPKNEVSWLHEYTEWPRSSTNGFPLSWWHGHIPRWQCQDSSGSDCERVVQGTWDIIFTHGLTTTESRPLPHWESLGCAEEGFAQWSDSPINTRSYFSSKVENYTILLYVSRLSILYLSPRDALGRICFNRLLHILINSAALTRCSHTSFHYKGANCLLCWRCRLESHLPPNNNKTNLRQTAAS